MTQLPNFIEMTENERVRYLRKEILKTTASAFGKRIGLSQPSISALENGERAITDRIRRDIIREWNVDYIWLTTGEGEPLVQYDEDTEIINSIERIMASEHEVYKEFVKSLVKLDEATIAGIEKMLKEFVKNVNEKEGN